MAIQRDSKGRFIKSVSAKPIQTQVRFDSRSTHQVVMVSKRKRKSHGPVTIITY